MKSLSLSIESDLGNVTLAALAVKAVCLYAGLTASDADHVELCMAEAITNSILHAYHGKSSHQVAISVRIVKDQLEFEICDAGTAMSPDQAKRLESEERAHENDPVDRALLSESGRGLEIIRRVMDEVTYKREANRNCVAMVKRISRV